MSKIKCKVQSYTITLRYTFIFTFIHFSITDLEAKNKAAEEKAEEEKKNILKDLEELKKVHFFNMHNILKTL